MLGVGEKTLLVARLYPHIEAIRELLASDYEELRSLSITLSESYTNMQITEHAPANNQDICLITQGIDFDKDKIEFRKRFYWDSDNNNVSLIDDGYME